MTPGQIAYEACPGAPYDRVPWDKLAPHWREYWNQIGDAVHKALREEPRYGVVLPDGFLESIATTEMIKAADRRARIDCARIVSTLAERPYDCEPEFGAIMAAEAAILKSIGTSAHDG